MVSSDQGIRKRQVVTLRHFDTLGVLRISVFFYVLYIKLRQGTAKGGEVGYGACRPVAKPECWDIGFRHISLKIETLHPNEAYKQYSP